jgi:hypothetical protein
VSLYLEELGGDDSIVSTDEVIDRFTQLFDIDKAGSPERY